MGGRKEDRGVMTHHETQWQSFSIFQLSTSWIHVCCCFVSCWLKSEDLSQCDVLTLMSDLLNKVVSPAICQSPWLCLVANIITDGLMVPGLLCPERWIISHPGLVWLFLQVWRLFWWVVIFIFILRISSFYQASYHNHWLSCSGVNNWVWIIILLFSPPGALYNMNHTKDAQLASFWDFHSGVMIQQIAWRHHHHYHHLKYTGGCTTQDRCTSVTGPTSKAKCYSLVWSR